MLKLVKSTQYAESTNKVAVLYVVRAYSSIQDLTGNGVEYLTDQYGEVIAQFYNGNFVSTPSKCTAADANELTIKAA